MQPDLILTPFGENAAPGTIEPIPETLIPGDPVQRASWNAGFPAVTMTPLAAGGIPPRGQDFNGVLKAISEHTVFVGGGGQYKWDAAFAAADGYALGAQVQKAGNDGFWLNLVDGNDTDPDAAGAGWIDAVNSTLPYALDTGAANAYVATYAPALTGLANGQVVRFKAENANNGASTFNPNGLGAKPIVTLTGAALSVGAIQAGGHVWLQYDTSIGAGSWVSLLSAGADTLNAPLATVAAAATINLTTGAPNTSQIIISGSGVNIANFTVGANRFFVVRFSGANTLVNSASLVTQRGTDIITAAGDTCLMCATAANVVEVRCYTRYSSPAMPASQAASGTSVDFSSIPSWINRVVLKGAFISTNGTSPVQIQLNGVTTGYAGSVSGGNSGVSSSAMASGFRIDTVRTAPDISHIRATIERVAGDTWMCAGQVGDSNAAAFRQFTGTLALGGGLTSIRITTIGGVDFFDVTGGTGTFSISYEE